MRPDLFDRRRATTLLVMLALLNPLYALSLILHFYGGYWSPEFPEGYREIPDFAAFWAAGAMTLDGTPALAYDWFAHKAVQMRGLGLEYTNWMPWLYPPHFQLIVTPFASVPVWGGMALWILVMLAVFLWVCWRILPDPLSIAAGLAVAPTAMILVNGQTGLLTGALLGLMLLDLDRRPLRAGAALGLLSIKPQLAVVLPLVLLAEGRWRVLLGAAGTFLALVAVSSLLLGAETWIAFIQSITQTSEVFHGDEGPWDLFASLYGWGRHLGLPFLPAILIHAVVAMMVLSATLLAWRAPSLSMDVKAALLCFAAAAVTPRILNYDLHFLLIGALFQIHHALRVGFFAGEQAVLALCTLAASISMIITPGVTALLPPALFVSCWLGRVRGRATQKTTGTSDTTVTARR